MFVLKKLPLCGDIAWERGGRRVLWYYFMGSINLFSQSMAVLTMSLFTPKNTIRHTGLVGKADACSNPLFSVYKPRALWIALGLFVRR